MLFSSELFLYYFLPIVIFTYFIILPKKIKIRNYFLLIASLCFYAWGEPIFVFLMMLSCLMNWIFGLWIDNYRIYAKYIMICMLIYNLSLLFIFKYLNFTSQTLVALGLNINLPTIILPIGISFFTFQSISYVIDVYRRKGKAQRNPINVGLYISLFPQLIAGPIVRYETIAKEIGDRNITKNGFTIGIERFIIGLSKKILLANNMAIIADHIFTITPNNLTLPLAWLGAITYTLQIYFDFSGYSDMAIGLGRIFGFHFLENFNYPYMAHSISDFWRRWHISLGSWFRDYVYIPLGGNRVNTRRLYLNLLIVWFLTGLWHGANWTFIIWGLLYFLLLCFEKSTRLDTFSNKATHLYTLFFIIIGWVIFRSNSIKDAYYYLSTMFDFNKLDITPIFTMYMCEYKIEIILSLLFSFSFLPQLYNKYIKPINILHTTMIFLLLLLSATYLAKDSYNPFIYFNF